MRGTDIIHDPIDPALVSLGPTDSLRFDIHIYSSTI